MEDLRLLLLFVVATAAIDEEDDDGWGEDDTDGDGEVFRVIIVDIDGSGDEAGGEGETTFIIGDIIVFRGVDKEVGGHERISLVVFICSCDFCSFSTVDIVSRLSDSRNFDRNTSATSSEPKVFFKALNRNKKKSYKWLNKWISKVPEITT